MFCKGSFSTEISEAYLSTGVRFTPEAEIRFGKKREGYPGEGNPPSTASTPLFGGMGMKRPNEQTPQRASSFQKRGLSNGPNGSPTEGYPGDNRVALHTRYTTRTRAASGALLWCGAGMKRQSQKRATCQCGSK